MARFIQIAVQDDAAVREELIAGLTAPAASVSPKHFYDVLGSKLFEAICELPAYYPTRTEAAIFERARAEIAEVSGQGSVLIDLGAGNCVKAARLFSALQPQQYVPLDISVDFMHEAVARLQQQHPSIDMLAIGIDFSASLALPAEVRDGPRLFFYPGSSLGNFTPEQALHFLRHIRAACGDDGALLVGVDLIKDKPVLDAAYDDPLGVTACFNLNVLNNVNQRIGTDFELRQWKHVGFFNAAMSRVEMHLEATENLTVRWQGASRRFERGERIHTENSYKYSRQSFSALLHAAGFGNISSWTDPREWFLVCHAQAN